MISLNSVVPYNDEYDSLYDKSHYLKNSIVEIKELTNDFVQYQRQMSIENNSEKIPKDEMEANSQATNTHHFERQIEELRNQLSRIEQEWLQWKANASLLSNNKDSNRQKEQLCNGQL